MRLQENPVAASAVFRVAIEFQVQLSIARRARIPKLPATASWRFDALRHRCYDQNAGWSSLVARWAHNPKVGGSNPPPATNLSKHFQPFLDRVWHHPPRRCPGASPDLAFRNSVALLIRRQSAGFKWPGILGLYGILAGDFKHEPMVARFGLRRLHNQAIFGHFPHKILSVS